MKQTLDLIHCLDLLFSVSTETVYVVDVLQKQFCYVKSDDLFLCGFSVEDVQKLGCDFFRKIVYPADFFLWTDIGEAILQYLKKNAAKRDEIDYFTCTFRLQRTYSFVSRPLPQMVYHRIKPVWEDNELRYLLCNVGTSAFREVGNLCLHNKDGARYDEYNFRTRRWTQDVKKWLTEREIAILIFAQQGKSVREIALCLCKGDNTIRNQIKALFLKLKVHSMQEAIEFAYNYGMLYSMQHVGSKKCSCSKSNTNISE